MSIVYQHSVRPSATMRTYLGPSGFAQPTRLGPSEVPEGKDSLGHVASSGDAFLRQSHDTHAFDTKDFNFAGEVVVGQPGQQQAREQSPSAAGRPLGTETCEVQGMTCEIPMELLALQNLSGILSLETWNDVLTDDDREQLAQFLPPVDGEDLQEALQDLLGGFNVNFGNPRDGLYARLRSGQCNPRVASFKKGLQILQRKRHYHNLRCYHNKMVNCLLDMKRMWQLLPESHLEQKLQHWSHALGGINDKQASTRKFVQVNRLSLEPPISGDKDGQRVSYRQHVESSSLLAAAAEMKGAKAGGMAAGLHAPSRCISSSELDEGHAAANATNIVSTGKAKRKRSAEAEDEPVLQGEEEQLAFSPQKRGPERQQGSAWREAHTFKKEKSMTPPSSEDSRGKEGYFMERRGTKTSARAGIQAEQKGMRRAGLCLNESLPLRHAEAGVGFSILHLLSAVRSALLQTRDLGSEELEWLAVPDIVDRVRKCPGDPRMLDAKQGLPDLVRQALSVLQTKAPPGTRMWKPFVQQKKQYKEWAWCGVVPQESENFSVVHVEPENWGVAEKALAKLQERLLESLKSNSAMKVSGTPPTLKLERFTEASGAVKIAGLEQNRNDRGYMKDAGKGSPSFMSEIIGKESPADRSPIYAKSVEKDGCKVTKEALKGSSSLAFQKSQVTLPELTPQMREMFRAEERSRFSFPQKAFRYTAVDGGKSIVAPIQRTNGKSLGKARDHAMLVTERPPHVTILSLVRDAAARLPNAVGTRADVCLLLKDSQYFVEETPDSQVHQIVSGAMDRLHYERDPCIKFHADKKLWQYLHRDRSPEDFEADGTMSTRHWGKRKPSDNLEEVAVEENGEDSLSLSGSPSDEPLAIRKEHTFRKLVNGRSNSKPGITSTKMEVSPSSDYRGKNNYERGQDESGEEEVEEEMEDDDHDDRFGEEQYMGRERGRGMLDDKLVCETPATAWEQVTRYHQPEQDRLEDMEDDQEGNGNGHERELEEAGRMILIENRQSMHSMPAQSKGRYDGSAEYHKFNHLDDDHMPQYGSAANHYGEQNDMNLLSSKLLQAGQHAPSSPSDPASRPRVTAWNGGENSHSRSRYPGEPQSHHYHRGREEHEAGSEQGDGFE